MEGVGTMLAISEFGYQLTKFGLMNCYLVREEDGFTLVDTSMGAAKQVVEAVKALGQGPVRRIMLTHAHGDHIGSLDALCQHGEFHLGGAVGTVPEVAISQREWSLLPKPPKQDLSLLPGEPPCKIKGSLPGAVTAATHALSDGELYWSLRCIATPGHTPGHFSFWDERDGTLYAGDALVTVGGQPHVAGFGPWFFPLPKLATWHRPTALESVEKMVALGVPVRWIAAGHGPVVAGAGLLEAAVKAAR